MNTLKYKKEFTANPVKKSSSSGFRINYFTPSEEVRDHPEKLTAHRDDFYLFLLVESGHTTMMVDLQEIILQTSSVFFVLPGQVHRRFNSKEKAQGWFVAIEATIIPSDYKDAFESLLCLQKPLQLSSSSLAQCKNLLHLLNKKYHEDPDKPFHIQVMCSLLHSFLGIVAGSFIEATNTTANFSRTTQIAQQFKKLLVHNMFTIKNPSSYASLMHISESYLNEAIKKNTGFPISYWIQHHIVLEAKRLLYYTNSDVNEIACQLGFEDITYFCRIFKNFTGVTPISFRAESLL